MGCIWKTVSLIPFLVAHLLIAILDFAVLGWVRTWTLNEMHIRTPIMNKASNS